MAINGGPGPPLSTWPPQLYWCKSTCVRVQCRPWRQTHLDLDDMLRHYTPTLAIMWLALLFVLPLVSGHMIEVPASKKECFFEDLHVNDKVCPLSTINWVGFSPAYTDDGDVPSRRGWSP